MRGAGVFRDLIGRTVALLSIATALVALSVAFELPQRGAGGTANAAPHGASVAHGGGTSMRTTRATRCEGFSPYRNGGRGERNRHENGISRSRWPILAFLCSLPKTRWNRDRVISVGGRTAVSRRNPN